MELNDKLINYLDLSTFQQNILNDASVSEKATWTSLKINSEIEVLLNDISTLQWTCIDDISTLKNSVDASLALKADKSELEDYATLNDVSSYATEEYVDTAIAGVGGDAIEDVSVLPDAGENKSKFVRLASDDKVYMSELKSRTEVSTNRLPDEQQIDKAYLYEDPWLQYHYLGAYTVTFLDGEVSGYGWLRYKSEDEWYFYLTEDDAEHIQNNSVCYSTIMGEEGDSINLTNKTVTTQHGKNEYKSTLSGIHLFPIPAIYNAPESAQIGNAQLEDADSQLGWIYDGTPVTITINNQQFTGYKWLSEDAPNDYILTNKQASNIYFYNDNGTYYSDAKCYRVSNGSASSESIKKLYILQLNAPDSEQVDNAYAYNSDMDYTYLYKGQTTVYFTDGTLDLYLWKANAANIVDIFSKYPASQQYNIENVYGTTGDNELDISYDSIQNKYVSSTKTVSEAEEIISVTLFDAFEYVELYNIIKYQRAEVTEEWDWQPLTDNATNDDIDLMFASESHIVKRVLMKANDRGYDMTIKEGFVNVNDETMEYEGQTYYKWIKYEERVNGESIPDEIELDDTEYIAVLTTSLNPSLPFNSSSPEWAYTIGIFTNGTGYQDEGMYNTEANEEFPVEALIHADGSITYEE